MATFVTDGAPTATEPLVSKVSVRVQVPALRFTAHGELAQVLFTEDPSAAANANTALLAPSGNLNSSNTVRAMLEGVIAVPDVISEGINSYAAD
jgi:hypothetical protein